MRENPGKWLRVDEKGNTPNDAGYKRTQTKGRTHLVKHSDVPSVVDVFLEEQYERDILQA